MAFCTHLFGPSQAWWPRKVPVFTPGRMWLLMHARWGDARQRCKAAAAICDIGKYFTHNMWVWAVYGEILLVELQRLIIWAIFKARKVPNLYSPASQILRYPAFLCLICLPNIKVDGSFTAHWNLKGQPWKNNSWLTGLRSVTLKVYDHLKSAILKKKNHFQLFENFPFFLSLDIVNGCCAPTLPVWSWGNHITSIQGLETTYITSSFPFEWVQSGATLCVV